MGSMPTDAGAGAVWVNRNGARAVVADLWPREVEANAASDEATGGGTSSPKAQAVPGSSSPKAQAVPHYASPKQQDKAAKSPRRMPGSPQPSRQALIASATRRYARAEEEAAEKAAAMAAAQAAVAHEHEKRAARGTQPLHSRTRACAHHPRARC